MVMKSNTIEEINIQFEIQNYSFLKKEYITPYTWILLFQLFLLRYQHTIWINPLLNNVKIKIKNRY